MEGHGEPTRLPETELKSTLVAEIQDCLHESWHFLSPHDIPVPRKPVALAQARQVGPTVVPEPFLVLNDSCYPCPGEMGKPCSPSEGLFEALVELLPVPREAYVWASAPSPDTIHPIPPAVMHRRSCCGKRRKNLASEPSSLSLRQSALSQWLLMLVKQEGFQARAHNPVFFQEACVESVDSCPVPPSQHQQLHYVCTRELASHQEISVSICFPGDKTPGKVWAEEGNPSPWSTLEKTFSFPKPSQALLAAAAFRHQLNPISLLRFGHFR